MTTHSQHNQQPTPCRTDAAAGDVAGACNTTERKRAVEDLVCLLARITAQQIIEERRAPIARPVQGEAHTSINHNS